MAVRKKKLSLDKIHSLFLRLLLPAVKLTKGLVILNEKTGSMLVMIECVFVLYTWSLCSLRSSGSTCRHEPLSDTWRYHYFPKLCYSVQLQSDTGLTNTSHNSHHPSTACSENGKINNESLLFHYYYHSYNWKKKKIKSCYSSIYLTSLKKIHVCNPECIAWKFTWIAKPLIVKNN